MEPITTHNSAPMKNIDGTVKKQALLLEKEMPELVKEHLGKFVAFFNGAVLIKESHEACYLAAEKAFGRDRGFVVNEITLRPRLVSSLIKF